MEPTSQVEVVKEFSLGEVRAIRFEGLAAEFSNSPMLHFTDVKFINGTSPLALNSVDNNALVGMLKLDIAYADNRGMAIKAQGLLDYSSPERLLLETGQLAIRLELRLAPDAPEGRVTIPTFGGTLYPETVYVLDVRLQQVASNHPLALVPAPMSWLF